MKNNRLLKALIILIIIAICLISFVGIFVKDNNQRINILPDYFKMKIKLKKIAA